MIPYIAALVFFVLFAAGVLRDRRRFRNAVFLGLALATLAIGVVDDLAKAPVEVFEIVVAAILVGPALGILVLAGLLVANGVTMVRKEGRGIANLLSLLAGLGILAFVALLGAAVAVDDRPLEIVATSALLVVGYVSFLFACFIGYAYLYGRMPVRGDVDYIVVLGSGLVDGDQVPPLLAGRLDRGLAVYEAQSARGGKPILLVSGGRGTDEVVPEAVAMADYLLARGVPADRVVRETRSTTTTENMRFSREIMAEAKPGFRCLVVTNNYHAFRAAMEARKAGLGAQVIGSPTARYFWPSATIREFAAVFLAHAYVNLGICAALALAVVAAWTQA
ncbi:YdcF family protein [Streptodolium elevatio]